MSEDPGILTTQWDGYLREGPGAATTAVPVVQAVTHEEMVLEPEYKRMPIGPDHILYPIMVGLAAFPMLLGSAGHHMAEELPEDETHPFFPDHFWPYPVIMVAMLIGVGLLSLFVQQNMQLEQNADPRAVVLPRPDWYFLWLFQMLKLGPELLMSLVVPPLIIAVILLWPFIDAIGGRRLAARSRCAGHESSPIRPPPRARARPGCAPRTAARRPATAPGRGGRRRRHPARRR
jgi:hypothetical protein